jgi:hypothetical protein
MKRDEISIPKPCSVDWAEMSGDEQQRFCGQCSKDVHNLSEMTEPEARTLLKQPNVCVRVATRSDGTIRFQSRRRFLAAAIATTIALPAAAAVEVQAETGGALARLASAAYSLLLGAPEPEPEPEPDLVDVEMGDVAPIEDVLMGALVLEPAVEEAQQPTLGRVQAR